ncbi:hypothetical protein Ancab_031980 [Ancistrocladus abbreviatus]
MFNYYSLLRGLELEQTNLSYQKEDSERRGEKGREGQGRERERDFWGISFRPLLPYLSSLIFSFALHRNSVIQEVVSHPQHIQTVNEFTASFAILVHGDPISMLCSQTKMNIFM